jgi:hypothetical protein
MPEVKQAPKAKKEPKKETKAPVNHITMRQLAEKSGYSYVTLAMMVRQGKLVPSCTGSGGNKMGRRSQLLFSPALVMKFLKWIERGKQHKTEVIQD